jgi:hypothetical protein
VRASQLDELLPRYDFHERHHRLIAAPPDRVYHAIGTVTLREMPLVPLLFDLRALPSRLAGRGGLPRKQDEPLLPQMLASGFTLLAEDPGRELVIGLIAQMWQRGGQNARIRDAGAFLAFDRPGFVKAAMNFLIGEREDEHPRSARRPGTWVETETRVLATDAASRRGFGRYWLFIRPGSGLIRHSLLRAVARRAEDGFPPIPNFS